MALDPPQDDQKDEPTNPAKRAGEGEDLTNAELEEEWELEIRRDDSDLRREEIESAFRQLEAEGRIEPNLNAAKAWARRLEIYANESIVRDVADYTSRLAKVVKVADKIRNKLGRRIQEPEFNGTLETHIIAGDIVSGLNQGRSVLGRGMDLHIDLPETGAQKFNKRDRQDWQLSWLAVYGPESSPMSADSIVLDDQSYSTISTWIAAQQALVFPIRTRPRLEDFLWLSSKEALRRNNDSGNPTEWFKNLYAHQRLLYVTGEFLVHLNQLGVVLLRNRNRISAAHLSFLLQQLREMHLATRDASVPSDLQEIISGHCFPWGFFMDEKEGFSHEKAHQSRQSYSRSGRKIV